MIYFLSCFIAALVVVTKHEEEQNGQLKITLIVLRFLSVLTLAPLIKRYRLYFAIPSLVAMIANAITWIITFYLNEWSFELEFAQIIIYIIEKIAPLSILYFFNFFIVLTYFMAEIIINLISAYIFLFIRDKKS